MFRQKEWDLAVLQPKSIAAAMKEVEHRINKFVKHKSKLKNSISQSQFMKLIHELEDIKKTSSKLAIYVHLKFCENSTDQKAVATMSRIESFLTTQANKLLFFSMWFKKLPDKKATQLIKGSGKYHYYLDVIRKNRKHTLEEEQEKIINIKDVTGSSALVNIYELTTTGFEFTFNGKAMTQEELTTYVKSGSSKVRKDAYMALLGPYKKHRAVLGEIYKNIVTDWREENIGLRGHKSPISVRNNANDIPDKAVEVLLRVCEKNYKVFQQFFEIKRKRLGLKKLRRFDLYAPLKEEKTKIPYDDAVNMVLETFESFSPAFYTCAKKIIDQNHVHSTITKGKRSGAFCCPATIDHPPFVLLNYTGKFRDVSTLAHELGHGIHFSLAQVQTEFTHDACLPLAETASIFSEMLLSERMLEKNPKMAKEMLFRKLDDLYASIARQAGFVLFENKAHQMFKEGKTVDEVSAVYLKMLKKQLGPKVEVDDMYAYEWVYIPHIFHTPFYCYAYAFGNLLTLALYEMYKEQGERFVRKLEKMLSLGGADTPIKIARIVGADITSEKFWQKGFDAIKAMMKRL